MENFAVALVADNQVLLGVEHREAASHVVERDLKPSVELLKILFETLPVTGGLERLQATPEVDAESHVSARPRWVALLRIRLLDGGRGIILHDALAPCKDQHAR